MTGDIQVVVDRREGDTVVLVDDRDLSYEVSVKALPEDCQVEGAVLDVPIGASREPDWARARRNHAEEASRVRNAADRLARLRRTDPGGDVAL